MKKNWKSKKQDNWYTKKRFFDGFTNWILTNPKALGVTMIMGHVVAFILFLVLFIFAWSWSWGILAKAFLGLGLGLTLWNLIKYYRTNKKTGSIYENMSMQDMLFGGRK